MAKKFKTWVSHLPVAGLIGIALHRFRRLLLPLSLSLSPLFLSFWMHGLNAIATDAVTLATSLSVSLVQPTVVRQFAATPKIPMAKVSECLRLNPMTAIRHQTTDYTSPTYFYLISRSNFRIPWLLWLLLHPSWARFNWVGFHPSFSVVALCSARSLANAPMK